MTKSNYDLLIEKLDQFIRKYYINQLIRGVLYCMAIVLVLFLLISLAEHYFHFGTGVRKTMFYSFIGISLFSITGLILLPLLRYFKLGQVISHEQAASIIGDHFGNVKDKLLNILQLRQQAGENNSQKDLLLASINQKSDEIKPVPFKAAIDLGKNRKYLRYALPPLMLLVVLLFAAPSMIKDSTARLINNNVETVREAPFKFNVNQEELTVVQFEDFNLRVNVDGEVLPNEVFIDIDNYKYKLTALDKNTFSYTFNNVQKNTDFKLTAGGFDSEDYELDVLKKPNIQGFEVKLDYPAYTQRTDETLANIGDLVVPMGTKINWVFNALHTSAIDIQFSGQKKEESKRFSDGLFTLQKRAMRDQNYMVYVSNENLPNADSVAYSLTVVPDLHPNINVKQFADSTDSKLLFFVGDASDDYGMTSLSFNYTIQKEDGMAVQPVNIPINSQPEGKSVQYDYTWDIVKLGLKPGDKITYYFEVFDNDAVNGKKSAKTQVMTFAMPTVEEFDQMEEENSEEVKDKLQKAKDESDKIKDEMKQLREKLLQEKELDWQSRKEIEKLLDRQKNLEKQIEDAKKAFEENLKNQEEFSQPNEELLEKQEQVQQLFEDIMSEEMKELMQKMEELLQEMQKDEALEDLENMQMSDEELEKDLDRMLEMFKQLEMEKEMQETIDKLEELAEKEEQLSKETEQKSKSQEQLQKEQEQLNKEFEDLQKKMDKMEEKNQELQNKKNLGDMKEQSESIQQDMEQSQQEMQQQQNQKASESQKKAAQKMKKMASQMQQQMQQQQMEQMQEDMDALRQLLENLMTLSFEQEDVMENVSKTAINTPNYVELVQGQYKIKDDFKLVEDSLQALSKRVFQIESFVTEKVNEVKKEIKSSLEELEERKKPQAAVHQQSSMKGLNDLALMLSEVLNQMQQQMANAMPGSQMCNKPGGQSSMPQGSMPKNMGDLQKQLNDQMQKMREQGKDGQKGMSKEFAKMAARQAALRRMLEEKQKGRQEQGKGQDKELQKIIDEMDKTETELVNKRLNNRTMKRQQDIVTRLLEHEKAERQQEFEEKRKAERTTQKERKMPPSLEEYIKKREAEIDMYKTVSPDLKPYYKFLVEEYFKKLKESK